MALPTWSIADSSVKGRSYDCIVNYHIYVDWQSTLCTYDANVKSDFWLGQAFCVLQVGKSRDS